MSEHYGTANPSEVLRRASAHYERDLSSALKERRIYTKWEAIVEASSKLNMHPDSSWGFMQGANMDFNQAIALAEKEETS